MRRAASQPPEVKIFQLAVREVFVHHAGRRETWIRSAEATLVRRARDQVLVLEMHACVGAALHFCCNVVRQQCTEVAGQHQHVCRVRGRRFRRWLRGRSAGVSGLSAGEALVCSLGVFSECHRGNSIHLFLGW